MCPVSLPRICCGSLEGHQSTVWSIDFDTTGDRLGKSAPLVFTVEPPNNGHVGDEHFVRCSEVVPSSEEEMYEGRGQTVCPL